MKRSEMIKKIRNSTSLHYEDVDLILSIFEKNGMLPPRHFNVKWEPENEPSEPNDPRWHGLNGWEEEI